MSRTGEVGFPWCPVVVTLLFLQMAQVPPLIGELGSHKLQGAPNLPKQKRGVA